VNRPFDNFLGQPTSSGTPVLWAPVADMYETRNKVEVTAELPGLEEKDIHLSVVLAGYALSARRHLGQASSNR
jgi:HSP20 family molecular chaperone IbpA